MAVFYLLIVFLNFYLGLFIFRGLTCNAPRVLHRGNLRFVVYKPPAAIKPPLD